MGLDKLRKAFSESCFKSTTYVFPEEVAKELGPDTFQNADMDRLWKEAFHTPMSTLVFEEDE